MAHTSDRARNNVRAGLFVGLTVALALTVYLILQRISLTPRNQYRVRFLVENGVAGLSPGGEVRVGGLKRGVVTAITPITEDGAIRSIDVDIELDATLRVYSNAEVVRVAPIIGNTAWLNFASLGGPNVAKPSDPTPALLRPGDELQAAESPGILANIVGGESAGQIVQIIDRADTFSTVLERFPTDYEDKVVPALDAASATIVKLRDDYNRWSAKVDDALTSAANAAGNLETGTKDAVDLIADVRGVVSENRPRIANSLTNLESATGTAKDVVERVRAETLPQLSGALAKGESALDNLTGLLDRVDAEVATQLPGIDRILDEIRTAAGQLKLATIEVRRSPWRLLYRPSTDEVVNENLYDATRAFVIATGDLRAAGDGLDELLRTRPDVFAQDAELRTRLQTSLIDALGRYEDAQRRLYGALLGEGAPSGAASTPQAGTH